MYSGYFQTSSSTDSLNPWTQAPGILFPDRYPRRNWEVGEYADRYDRLVLLLDRVLHSDEVAFDVRQSGGIRRAVAIPGAKPAEPSLADLMGCCRDLMDLYDPALSYTADWQLFFDSYLEHDFGWVHPGSSQNMPFDERRLIADVYNDFLGSLRQQAIERGVKKWLADWKAGLAHQDETIHAYIAALAALYDLLPVRLDFHFLQSAVDAADLLECMSWVPSVYQGWRRLPSQAASTGQAEETRARIDPAVAMDCRNLFFRKPSGPERQVFEHMVGFLAKMECGGKQRANHFHCLFFFNARKGLDLELLINALTRRWDWATGYQGFVHNCHNSRWKQDMIARGIWALEVIERGNALKLARLDAYARRYFAKDSEQTVRVKPTPYANTLTRGRLSSDF